jgi:prolyl 4-hydroxylase
VVDQTDNIAAQLHAARALEVGGRANEATDLLRRIAGSGNVAAVAALGKHLLIYRPDCAGEGLNTLSAAAQRGDGESARLLSVFIAEGIGFPQNWRAALAALQHAADLGWEPAQSELRFLATEFGRTRTPAHTASEVRQWGALVEIIDFSHWLQAPPGSLISSAPRILFVKNFASPAICERLIELARPRMQAAQIYDRESGKTRYDGTRTNSDCPIILPFSDLVLALVRARIAALIRMPVPFFETPTVLHYKPGETFAPHHDYLDDSNPGFSAEIAQNGQRVVTFLLYLNDGFEGGETEFPLVGMRCKGNKGDALCFWNVLPNGSPDRQTMHAGLPPTQGEKWLLSQWVRNIPM